jgi:hypothetical protein
MNFITRKIILGVIILGTLAVGIINTYRIYKDEPLLGVTEYKTCGVITYKSESSHVNKHNYVADYSLVVNGEERNVGVATFSKFNVGDRICFTDQDKTALALGGLIIMCIFWACFMAAVLFAAFALITYLATGSI